MTRPTADLGAAMRRRDAFWASLTDAERAARLPILRADYAAAGWTLCTHADCPPWSCQIEGDRR